MPKESRISRADFQHMRGFRRISGVFFTLSYGSIPGRRAAGAAFVVSKKVALRAPDRNLIQRRGRSVLAKLLLSTDSPTAFVFIAKKGAEKALFSDVKADIESLVARARASR